MKAKEFKKLLEGVRELGSALRGEKGAVARFDHIAPDSVVAIRAKLGSANPSLPGCLASAWTRCKIGSRGGASRRARRGCC